MRELNVSPSAVAVAKHYRGLADGIVIDVADRALAPEIAALGLAVDVVPTVMRSQADRIALADECIALARRLIARR